MQRIDDTHYTKAIREWNTKFHIVPEMTPLRAMLIQEEVDELIDALHRDDRQEIVDGLCDVVYVVAGTQVAKGELCTVIAQVQCANIDEAIEMLSTIEVEDSLNSEFANWFLGGLISHCEHIATMLHIDLRKNFDIVHANNMAKTWTMDQLGMTDVSSTEVTIRGLNEYIVKNLDGKVIKPPGHPKPTLVL